VTTDVMQEPRYNNRSIPVDVSPELAKLILSQPASMSIVEIKQACDCTAAEVRSVFNEEKQWRETLGTITESPKAQAKKVESERGGRPRIKKEKVMKCTFCKVGLIKKLGVYHCGDCESQFILTAGKLEIIYTPDKLASGSGKLGYAKSKVF